MMNDMCMQKCGSLCFWGDWFGRPMDNIHTPVSASFDEAEELLVIPFRSVYKDLHADRETGC